MWSHLKETDPLEVQERKKVREDSLRQKMEINLKSRLMNDREEKDAPEIIKQTNMTASELKEKLVRIATELKAKIVQDAAELKKGKEEQLAYYELIKAENEKRQKIEDEHLKQAIRDQVNEAINNIDKWKPKDEKIFVWEEVYKNHPNVEFLIKAFQKYCIEHSTDTTEMTITEFSTVDIEPTGPGAYQGGGSKKTTCRLQIEEVLKN